MTDGSVPLLECQGISKVFGTTPALRDVSLTLNSGEILGLLGENGAGKSTLIKILAGVYQPDGGVVKVGGRELPPTFTPRDAQRQGMVFIHQRPALFDSLSVADNIGLSQGFSGKRGFLDKKALTEHARTTIDSLSIPVDVGADVELLPSALRSSIAIAAALGAQASIAVLDEPTATLSAKESIQLYDRVRRLADSGCGVIFVSHRIDEVLDLCHRVAVLRDGALVGDRPTSELDKPELVKLIVGAEVEQTPAISSVSDRVILELSNVTTIAGTQIDFALREGEILGLGGSVGAGHEELAYALFANSAGLDGVVTLSGTPLACTSPEASIQRGVGFVPGNRNQQGLALTMTASENLLMNPALARGRSSKRGSRGQDRAYVTEVLEKFDVRPLDPDREADTFSGGNAQKILVARWLQATMPLTILIEPTAGVDVGARAAIHATIQEAAERGQSFIVASSDMEELSLLCHRVLIFTHSRQTQEFSQPMSPPPLIASSLA